MSGGILIDDKGDVWPDNCWTLARRLGYRNPDFEVSAYALRNFGYVHLRPQHGGIRVALRAGVFSLSALTGALYALFERRPRRILLAVLWDDDWSYEMFTNLGSFAERTEDLADGKPIAARAPWLAAERDLEALALPVFAPVQPLVELWKESHGRISEDLPQALDRLGVLHRTVLVRQVARSTRLVFEHFGSSFKVMRPCESLRLIGRDMEDVPDKEYGEWVAESYAEALAGRRLRLDSVRAQLRTSEAATIRTRYDRLLMPWRAGGDFFVVGVSFRREFSTLA